MKSCLGRKNFFVVLVLTAVLGLFAEAGGAEPNLVSRWKLDEGTGSTAYDSAGNNHGDVNGAQWTAGQIDGALSFDGADDYVDCGNDNSLAITRNLTIAAWVKRASAAGSSKEVIVSKYDGGLYSYRLFFLGGGRVRWYLSSDGGTSKREYVNSTLQITDTNWHFIAATFESGTLKIYIDGADRSGSKKGNISSVFASTEPLFIGQENSGGYFNGLIDDVMILDRALSAEEIMQLCQEGWGGRAFNPEPEDGGTGVTLDAFLSWSPGMDAASHDVYFGTNYNDVNDADTSSPEYMGNQYSNSYYPVGLEQPKTYYWRIDEVNGPDTYKGDVWSFTTTGWAIEITDVYWAGNVQGGVIGVLLDVWPAAWDGWRCYLNGEEVPMEGVKEGTSLFAPTPLWRTPQLVCGLAPSPGSVLSSHLSANLVKSAKSTLQSSFKSPGRYIVPRSPHRRGISRISAKKAISTLPLCIVPVQLKEPCSI